MGRHYRTTGALGVNRTGCLIAGIIGGAVLVGATVGAAVPELDQPARIGAQAVRFQPPPPPPTPSPTPTPTTVSTTLPTSHQQALDGMLHAINAVRTAGGLAPVQRHHLVELAAQGHADDMAARRQMTHSGAHGSDAGDRLHAVGFEWSGWAENVGAGFVDPVAVVQSWMGSSGHRRNLLGNHAYIGVGVATSVDGVKYWALDLAS